MPDYRFDPLRKRYITSDGKVISLDVIRALRDRWADIQADVMQDMTERLLSGEWTFAEFEAAARVWLNDTIAAGYQLGRGGAAMMSTDDAFKLASIIRDQWNRTQGLIANYADMQMTDKQFASWISQKAGAAVNAFEQGQGGASGIDLPVYPADLETSCGLMCRCLWSIDEFDDRWEATWITSGDDRVCPECEARGEAYSPFIVYK